MSKKTSKKALRKALRNREKMVRYWMNSYWEARNELADAVNELDAAIKLAARVQKERERLG